MGSGPGDLGSGIYVHLFEFDVLPLKFEFGVGTLQI